MDKMKIIYVNDTQHKKSKCKTKDTIPIIQRTDIMLALLSANLNHDEHARLSNLYAEITYMEKKDLKYISEIAVSSQSDLEVYETLNKIKKIRKKNQA